MPTSNPITPPSTGMVFAAPPVDEPRRLFRRYTLLVGLVLTLMIATFAVKEYEFNLGLTAAETINAAGRQRMLSQRILFLTREPLPLTGADWQELAALIEQMASAHHRLTTDPAVSAAVHDVYFGKKPDGGPTLDSMMRDFLNAGRVLIDLRSNGAAREQLRDIGRYRLLEQLENAVATIQREFFRTRINLQRLAYITLAAAFAMVVFEVVVVFLPTQRFTRATLKRLQKKRAQLQEYAMRLEAELQISELLRKEQADFTYALSHELKSPGNTLAVLLQEMQTIPEISKLPEAVELVQMGVATVRRMAQMIESVVAYTHTIDGEMTCMRVDLDALIKEVQADLGLLRHDSPAKIVVQPLGCLNGNAAQLWVLFHNLLSNSIKFRASGRPLDITVRADRDAAIGTLTLYVSDNGIGIPPEHRQRVFSLFKRLHTSADYPGSGMGLTLCAHVAIKHGGAILVEDGPVPGVGCTFVVTLRDIDWSRATWAAEATPLNLRHNPAEEAA